MCQDRYGLDIVDGRLPAGSLDHGLDVIEIMRNINVFAAQFGYLSGRSNYLQGSCVRVIIVIVVGLCWRPRTERSL